MKTSIIAKVPTFYQYRSISHLDLPIKKHFDGSFSARLDFETKGKAINYLIERAYYLSEDEEVLCDMLRDIRKKNIFIYDAVTAKIVPTNKIYTL